MKAIYKILVFIFLPFIISCNNSNVVTPDNTKIDPFNNGTTERNLIVVISDIHLGADLTYTETKNNLSSLVNFLGQIRKSSNIKELVIAGDLIDEWFVPANVNTYQGKNQTDFVKRIAETNKIVFDAFNNIIKDGKITVTYVPGNHDLTITEENLSLVLPGIKQSRDDQQGIGSYSPADHPEMIIEHSHKYNYFCAPDPISNKDIAPGSILPPGYFFTRIAALHVIQKCKTAGDTIATIYPNETGNDSQNLAFIYWHIWKTLMLQLPIENKFSDKIIVTNINGFTDTYSVNDLIPFQNTPGGFIDSKLFKVAQDSWAQRQNQNHVAIQIPVKDAIQQASLASFADNQATLQYFSNPASNKRIVIFGHTHIAKIISSMNYKNQKSIYANSGTWIDSNPGSSTRNFVVVTPQNSNSETLTYVRVYNFENEEFNFMAADSLRY